MEDILREFEEVRKTAKLTMGILEREAKLAKIEAWEYKHSLQSIAAELRDGGITAREQRIFNIAMEALR
ncbi:hypothetical protein [Bacillus haynesii]|uniref:hypothetical protein n=1 Tax=Bacillus haynesii TaxID=1925021 RepID=UPI001F6091BC|nr:hypothetical protein [Bacillus haynesii]MCI4129407.1 hypothetical protein [Bacillus haynesii]